MARARSLWTGLLWSGSVASLALIWASQPSEAWAQQRSSGSNGSRNTSSGTFGARSLGGGASGGNRNFSGSGGGGGQMGGGSGQGAGRTTDPNSNIGTMNSNRSSGGRQPGQFVGADSNDATNFMSAMALGSAMSGGRGNRGNRITAS